MFEQLGNRLGESLDKLRGRGQLTEQNISDALREVRLALLEADVALPVVKGFVEQVRSRAVGTEVLSSLTPGQALLKVVNEELIRVLGGDSPELNLKVQPPAVILLAGLQGAGKTTTAAKLARWLKETQKKQVWLASADTYRPAAREQLRTLAGEIGVEYFHGAATQPKEIAREAHAAAKKALADVLILDTAGRLAIDAQMMDEIGVLHGLVNPAETLFVVDAMTGQDAANTAAAFGKTLPLTGVVLTKADGDARGGAALSVAQVTGSPVKFIGLGEKSDAFEVFHPDRIASRILGMGDVMSLVEEAERKIDKNKAEKLAGKLKSGKGFDLEDYREQMQQMQNMGGLGKMMEQLPGVKNLPQAAKAQIDDGQIRRQIAIVNSMTPKERQFPALIKASRKQRIAAGSGVQVQDVNRLLKQHLQMQKMMKKMAKGGMKKMLRGMGGGMGGGMPPGMPPGLR